MNAKNTGGQAFPRTGFYPPDTRGVGGEHLRELLAAYTDPAEGMSLRDYFASKALQGYCSNPTKDLDRDEKLAEWSYRLADAMLQERAK